jgi:hypothetical protein
MTIITNILNCVLIFLILIATINVVNTPTNIVVENITAINNTVVNDTTINDTIVNNTDIKEKINNHNELFYPKGNLQNHYTDNSCEIIANDFQKEYGGHLVFIAPLKASTGAWIKSRYSGHWLNQIYHDNQTIFIDYYTQTIWYDNDSMYNDMLNGMKNKFDSADINIKIYIAGIDNMPYPIIYNETKAYKPIGTKKLIKATIAIA